MKRINQKPGNTTASPEIMVGRQGTAARRRRRDFIAGGLSVLAAGLPTVGSAGAELADAADDRRYRNGLAVLKQVGGKDYDILLKRLAGLAPDMARLTVEFGYGDLLSRPGLDLAQRELCTVAALIAPGSVQPQLKYHMHGFLNVGGQPEELVELLILAVALAGFPAAINGIALLREVFGERAIVVAPAVAVAEAQRDRLAAGLDYLERLGVGPTANVELAADAPELARWSVEFAAGDIMSRRVLSEKQKQLAAISLLAAQGNRTAALRWHLAAARASAVTPGEIVEALMQLTAYAGFPAVLNAFFIASEVLGTPLATAAGVATTFTPALKDALRAGVEADSERRQRGARTLAATSKASGDAVVKSFDDLAPVLGQLLLEFSGGDIFARPGIDARTRELAAISALAAIGSKASETPLRVHVTAALNVGVTRREIVETLYNLLPYCGYPAVQQALAIALEATRAQRAA